MRLRRLSLITLKIVINIMKRIKYFLLFCFTLMFSMASYATVTYTLTAQGEVYTDSETLLSSSGSSSGDASIQFENVSSTSWTPPYIAFSNSAPDSTSPQQNWTETGHSQWGTSQDNCPTSGLYDTWLWDPNVCGPYDLYHEYDFSYASAYPSFSSYTIANDFSNSKSNSSSTPYTSGSIIAITANQSAIEYHNTSGGWFYHDVWRPGTESNAYNGNFGNVLFTETPVPATLNNHFSTGCSASASDIASCSTDDSNIYINFTDGSKLTLTLSGEALNRPISYGGESIVGGIMQFTSMSYQWSNTDIMAKYQGHNRDESITITYGFSSSGVQFDSQQLSVALNVENIASCTVSVPAIVDFGRIVGNVDTKSASFDVTATCDIEISDRLNDGTGDASTAFGLFRIDAKSPIGNYQSCGEASHGRCIPFKSDDGTNNTLLYIYPTERPEDDLISESDTDVHSDGIMPAITNSNGGTSTLNVTAKIADSTHRVTPGVHTAAVVITLYYN